jgi:hypothetical protein
MMDFLRVAHTILVDWVRMARRVCGKSRRLEQGENVRIDRKLQGLGQWLVASG